MGFLIFLAIVIAAGLGYVFRHKIVAKLTGQSESRIRRHLK